MQINSLGHINIIVDDLEAATEHYCRILSCEPVQTFPHFKNIGFSKSAGFLTDPDKVDVSIRFLRIKTTGIFLELMEYHNPKGEDKIQVRRTNDLGGPRHICLKVKNIHEAFSFIKSQKDIRLITDSPSYKPFKIDPITPDEFYFHDPKENANHESKLNICKIIAQISYFYFVDKYGIQWEFEEGHDDIGH
jgi:methylmalonyl-CoA/ethylmalonyl-CoA epimerase